MSAMITGVNRRMFLLAGVGAGAAVSLGLVRPERAGAAGKDYELPALPYGFDALEPHIDKMTMEIHHDRHHKAYVDNLNKALEGQRAARHAARRAAYEQGRESSRRDSPDGDQQRRRA